MVQADVSDEASVARLVRSVRERFGRIDILVNNAGTIRRAPAVDFSEADGDAVLDVNLNSLFRLCQLAGRGMLGGRKPAEDPAPTFGRGDGDARDGRRPDLVAARDSQPPGPAPPV